ncbi:MAG: hypothetical protein AAFV19_10770 [Pseudomonadota bacterium]
MVIAPSELMADRCAQILLKFLELAPVARAQAIDIATLIWNVRALPGQIAQRPLSPV